MFSCGAAWQANATRFSTVGNAAEVVGQTPWSARDAPVPPLGQWGQRLAGCEQADGGVGRGPGGPPHDVCRRPAPEKRVALAWQAARRWFTGAGFQPAPLPFPKTVTHLKPPRFVPRPAGL